MSDSEEERPRFGLGSKPARKWQDDGSSDAPNKKPKTAVGGSFAQRMMAKMGYVQGQGLGASGHGRLAPIETQLRPAGAGLGAVKEKTKQAKQEEKRAAALRGEVVEDSSDEERKRKKKLKEKRPGAVSSGASTPGATRAPKIKYRTAAEIEAESGGLQVPNVLKEIIDITGKTPKVHSSASGLLTPNENIVAAETEASKIARRARRDLEGFANEWAALSDKKRYIELENTAVVEELDKNTVEIEQSRTVLAAIQSLHDLTLESNRAGVESSPWEVITTKLENIEVMVHGNVDTNTLQEVSVAAIHPLFRTSMLEWEPLGDPSYLTPYLGRLKRLLGMDEESDSSINGLSYQSTRRTKSTTHYETMIYTLWLPVVRGAITNSWDVYNPTPLTALLTAWRPLLPAFVYSNVIEQLLVPRLTTALDSWRPSRSRKSRHYSPPPNEWLFDFLPFLPKSQTDPLLSSGLVTDLKRKIRKLLSNHDLSSPPPDYLNPFAPLLGSTLTTILTNTLLPRLRVHLDTTFIIDPADQDIAPFTHLLTYLSLFSPSTFAELLAQTFFPQFHQVLHLWLTSSFEHAEIMEWFMWWQSQFPESLRNLPVLEEQWNRALETINMALDLGDRAAAELPPPEAASSLQSSPALPTPAPAQQPPTSHELLPEPTMREVVEDWCADVGILLIPLHEAHRETGAPIFRLTASASGKGGVKVYIRGFLVYAQDKKEREKWEPVELDDTLVERAGG